MSNNKLNNIIFYIRYPYTALVIAIMWIGMAIIIVNQEDCAYEILLVATSISTIVVAILGFKNTK